MLQSTMDVLAGQAACAGCPVEPYSGAHRAALGALERAVLEGILRHPGDAAIGEQIALAAVDRFENGDRPAAAG